MFSSQCKMLKSLLLILLLLVCIATSDSSYIDISASDFSYKDTTIWPGQCQSGMSQSPIDIPTASTVYDASLGPLHFSANYADPSSYTLDVHNNGHTAEFIVTSGTLQMSGGGLPSTYTLAQFHFHWGNRNSFGAEHRVDGENFPLELHLVHWDAVNYNSIGEAANAPGGLAVVGVFYEIYKTGDPEMDSVEAGVRTIPNSDTTVPDSQNVNISNLLPQGTDFYRYNGSLTTPNCMESVIWTVARQSGRVEREEMGAFWSMFDKQGAPLLDIYRPTQPLNGRTVLRNFQKKLYSSRPSVNAVRETM